jgi:hypothetical protein
MIEDNTIRVRELDINSIHPSTERAGASEQGGSKIVVIGKPATGKSNLLRSIMYEKSHIIPVAMIMSGTEAENKFYGNFVPDLFIYDEYDEDRVESFRERQRISKENLSNPWAFLLIDDCTDDPKILKSNLVQSLFKNGRHYKMLLLLSLQYSMDIRPSLRVCIDGTFLMRETNLKNRKNLFENYAGVCGTFDVFCQLMDKITNDYTALYINNQVQSSNLEDCVFYYRAKDVPDTFKFGCYDFHKYDEDRRDPNYKRF